MVIWTIILLMITTYKRHFLWNTDSETYGYRSMPCKLNMWCWSKKAITRPIETISLYRKTWDCSLINFLSFLKFLSFVLFNLLKEDKAHFFQLPFYPPAAGVLFLTNDHTTLQTLLIWTDCCAHCLLFHEHLSSTETRLIFLPGNYDRSESL